MMNKLKFRKTTWMKKLICNPKFKASQNSTRAIYVLNFRSLYILFSIKALDALLTFLQRPIIQKIMLNINKQNLTNMFDINTSQKHTQQNFLNVNNRDLNNMFNINIGQTPTQQNFLREKP